MKIYLEKRVMRELVAMTLTRIPMLNDGDKNEQTCKTIVDAVANIMKKPRSIRIWNDGYIGLTDPLLFPRSGVSRHLAFHPRNLPRYPLHHFNPPHNLPHHFNPPHHAREDISKIALVVILIRLEPFMMGELLVLNTLNVQRDHSRMKWVHMRVILVHNVLFKWRKVNQSV